MTDQSESDGEAGRERFGDVIDRLSQYVDRPSSEEGDEDEVDDDHEDTEGDEASDGEAGEKTGGESVPAKRDELIVRSAVRERLEEMRVASAFYEPFDEKVDELVREAAERAEANGRKTVQARDL